MSKNAKTPASVLMSLMPEFDLNPYSLARGLNVSYTSIRNILFAQAGITVPMALRFAKFFGQSPDFWLDLQKDVDLIEAAKDKKLQAELKSIKKVEKPVAGPQKRSPGKSRKKPTLSDRRKKAAKRPGAKHVSRRKKR